MRLGQANDCTIHHTWMSHQNTVYWRIANLSNTITRNRSLQHTACDLYRESGMHEGKGGGIP